MRVLILFLLLGASAANSQCKTFMIGAKGDTLNCTDKQSLKQGKWIVHTESLRGEPGFDQEGEFKDGKKEGLWRTYNLQGDPLAIEHYRWGFKDGICQYFTLAGIVREESWKAIDPENPYDTVQVPDLYDPYKVTMKVVKVEGTTVKHGTWKYYDVQTGSIQKTETYFLDKLEDPKKLAGIKDSTGTDSSATALKPDTKAKPQAVLDYEKKNSGKKKIKVRNGSTGL